MKEIEVRLFSLLEKDGRLPPNEIFDMKLLVEHNEAGIALENYSSQLYEYGLSISAETMVELKSLGEEMKMDAKIWEILSIH